MPGEVQYALRNLQDVVGRGFRQPGEIALQRAQLGSQIDQARLQRPALELQAQKAQTQLDRRNQPATVAAIFPDIWAIGHGISKGKNENDTVVDKVASIFDAKLIKDRKDPRYGKIFKSNGEPLLMGVVDDNAEAVQNIILANTDPLRSARDKYEKQSMMLRKLEKKDPQLSSSEAQQLIADMDRTRKFMDDPYLQISGLEKQREYLSNLRGPEYQRAIDRIDRKMEKIAGQFMTPAQQSRFSQEMKNLKLQEDKIRAQTEAARQRKGGAESRGTFKTLSKDDPLIFNSVTGETKPNPAYKPKDGESDQKFYDRTIENLIESGTFFEGEESKMDKAARELLRLRRGPEAENSLSPPGATKDNPLGIKF